MGSAIDNFDLGGLRLASGEGRQIELDVGMEPFTLGADSYAVEPPVLPVRLEISRTTGQGYALRLRFAATLRGPCMRCLEPADASYQIDAREISQPGSGEELDSPYVEAGVLDLGGWARDALALNLPRAILCREDCSGLCPVCGANLNTAGAEHGHESEPDPRWAKLSEIRFDS
ncbi:MAG: YceD family protein [Solirubrobacteraceae bacterium]